MGRFAVHLHNGDTFSRLPPPGAAILNLLDVSLLQCMYVAAVMCIPALVAFTSLLHTRAKCGAAARSKGLKREQGDAPFALRVCCCEQPGTEVLCSRSDNIMVPSRCKDGQNPERRITAWSGLCKIDIRLRYSVRISVEPPPSAGPKDPIHPPLGAPASQQHPPLGSWPTTVSCPFPRCATCRTQAPDLDTLEPPGSAACTGTPVDKEARRIGQDAIVGGAHPRWPADVHPGLERRCWRCRGFV